MSAFVLKIIALVAMVIDHTGAAFPDSTPLEFRVIGRLTFPIFVYLLAEGFRYTRDSRKYLLRLFAFALISQPFYDWAVTRTSNTSIVYSPWQVDFFNYTNIFYTLFLGGMAIYLYQWLGREIAILLCGDPNKNPDTRFSNRKEPGALPICLDSLIIAVIAALPAIGLMWIADFLSTDYAAYGVLFIFIMYAVNTPKWLMLAVFTVMNVLQHRGLFAFFLDSMPIPIQFYWMIPATLLTVPMIAIYNKKRGPSLKWLFYIAYPGHLAVLAGLAFILSP